MLLLKGRRDAPEQMRVYSKINIFFKATKGTGPPFLSGNKDMNIYTKRHAVMHPSRCCLFIKLTFWAAPGVGPPFPPLPDLVVCKGQKGQERFVPPTSGI